MVYDGGFTTILVKNKSQSIVRNILIAINDSQSMRGQIFALN